MSKGKRVKESKYINIKRILTILIVLIVIIVITIMIYFNSKKENTENVKITDPTINIYYNSKEDYANELKEGQVITKQVSITSNKGTIRIKRKENNELKEYNGEILKDGVYLIEITTDNGLVQKNFTIDTLPPKISGVEDNKTYNTPQKITFDDIKDVELATLTKEDGTIIDLKAMGKKEYTVKENGVYILRVEDKYGNAILPIAFEITN